MGPFQVIETIRQQPYRLSLPEDWKTHPVFHVLLLKDWRTENLQEDQPVTTDEMPNVEEPYYEIEKILRWRKVKRNKTILKEYLVLWKGVPNRRGNMGPRATIQSSRTIEELFEGRQPPRREIFSKWWGHHLFKGGSSCNVL